MRVYGGVGVEPHTFINLAVDINKWISSCLKRFFSIVQHPLVCQGLLIIEVS